MDYLLNRANGDDYQMDKVSLANLLHFQRYIEEELRASNALPSSPLTHRYPYALNMKSARSGHMAPVEENGTHRMDDIDMQRRTDLQNLLRMLHDKIEAVLQLMQAPVTDNTCNEYYGIHDAEPSYTDIFTAATHRDGYVISGCNDRQHRNRGNRYVETSYKAPLLSPSSAGLYPVRNRGRGTRSAVARETCPSTALHDLPNRYRSWHQHVLDSYYCEHVRIRGIDISNFDPDIYKLLQKSTSSEESFEEELEDYSSGSSSHKPGELVSSESSRKGFTIPGINGVILQKMVDDKSSGRNSFIHENQSNKNNQLRQFAYPSSAPAMQPLSKTISAVQPLSSEGHIHSKDEIFDSQTRLSPAAWTKIFHKLITQSLNKRVKDCGDSAGRLGVDDVRWTMDHITKKILTKKDIECGRPIGNIESVRESPLNVCSSEPAGTDNDVALLRPRETNSKCRSCPSSNKCSKACPSANQDDVCNMTDQRFFIFATRNSSNFANEVPCRNDANNLAPVQRHANLTVTANRPDVLKKQMFQEERNLDMFKVRQQISSKEVSKAHKKHFGEGDKHLTNQRLQPIQHDLQSIEQQQFCFPPFQMINEAEWREYCAASKWPRSQVLHHASEQADLKQEGAFKMMENETMAVPNVNAANAGNIRVIQKNTQKTVYRDQAFQMLPQPISTSLQQNPKHGQQRIFHVNKEMLNVNEEATSGVLPVPSNNPYYTGIPEAVPVVASSDTEISTSQLISLSDLDDEIGDVALPSSSLTRFQQFILPKMIERNMIPLNVLLCEAETADESGSSSKRSQKHITHHMSSTKARREEGGVDNIICRTTSNDDEEKKAASPIDQSLHKLLLHPIGDTTNGSPFRRKSNSPQQAPGNMPFSWETILPHFKNEKQYTEFVSALISGQLDFSSSNDEDSLVLQPECSKPLSRQQGPRLGAGEDNHKKERMCRFFKPDKHLHRNYHGRLKGGMDIPHLSADLEEIFFSSYEGNISKKRNRNVQRPSSTNPRTRNHGKYSRNSEGRNRSQQNSRNGHRSLVLQRKIRPQDHRRCSYRPGKGRKRKRSPIPSLTPLKTNDGISKTESPPLQDALPVGSKGPIVIRARRSNTVPRWRKRSQLSASPDDLSSCQTQWSEYTQQRVKQEKMLLSNRLPPETFKTQEGSSRGFTALLQNLAISLKDKSSIPDDRTGGTSDRPNVDDNEVRHQRLHEDRHSDMDSFR
ncbi:unnamed protein product [Cyprideis torosa]|uniref:Uncharacterized protein n=2 Tax=Cyprideis torosa TaxID=163714 RepID=A0A7R8WLY8_9CRUS|nr:unnamed protein product [Cyprideis torosa]CAG0898670.1 unnamed protein product [Cyprideis torosa]